MASKRLLLLGSTGSIGVNTLILAKEHGIDVEVLVAGKNIDLLNQQIEQFNPQRVIIASADDISRVKHTNVQAGMEAILEAIEQSEDALIVNALVGYAGVLPTLKANELKKPVALANKESLVVAGSLLDMSLITPIDSEHFGLWYLLQNSHSFSKLYITASGGAFRDWELSRLKSATYQEALKHPNWSMGEKITIDSATMVNKLFEMLEARWLFDTSSIEALIERNSMVHAMVEYLDGSTTMHIAHADMKLPIAYALGIEVTKPLLKPANLLSMGAIAFEPIKKERYPIWEIVDELLLSPQRGVVVNSANEEAIEAFRGGKIGFLQMSALIIDAFAHFDGVAIGSKEEIIEIDKQVRSYVRSRL